MLIVQISDLSHVFGYNSKQIQTGIIMKGKGPYCFEYSYDILRKHASMIYSEIIEHNIVCDTKTPLLRCFSFISRVKSRDLISTE